MNEREGHCGCKTSIFKIVFPVKVGYTIDVMDANIDKLHLNSKVFAFTMFDILNTTYRIGTVASGNSLSRSSGMSCYGYIQLTDCLF